MTVRRVTGRRLVLLPLLLPLLLGALCGAAGAVRKDATEATQHRHLKLHVTNDGYEQPESLSTSYKASGYGFDFVMEPFRVTTATARSGDAGMDASSRFEWELALVTPADGAGMQRTSIDIDTGSGDSASGAQASFSCSDAGTEWALTVSQIDTTTGEQVRSRTVQIVCKYVRREIRSLSAEDRERFMTALTTVYSTSVVEGRAKYGPTFVNHNASALKHMGYNYRTGTATPFHTGTCFYTAHAAFTYEMERSLQLVDPTVAMAYWDYTIDSDQLGESWRESEVLDLFGFNDVDTSIPVPFLGDSFDADYTNDLHLLAHYKNNNPSRTVQRFDSLCGIQVVSTLPGCDTVQGALKQTSLHVMEGQLESNVHGEIHLLFGGATECSVDLGELAEAYPDLEDAFRYVASKTIKYWTQGAFNTPDTCTDDTTDFEDCRFRSHGLMAALKDSSDGQLHWSVATELASTLWEDMETYMTAYEHNGETAYRFTGMSADESNQLITTLTTHALSPGRMGHFTSAMVSPVDPIFHSSHAGYERLFTVARLSADNTGMDFSFVNDTSVFGRSWRDPQPFSNFVRDKSGVPYTHEALWTDIFDPESVVTPYIFDDLTPYCTSSESVDADSSSDDEVATTDRPQVQILEMQPSTVGESANRAIPHAGAAILFTSVAVAVLFLGMVMSGRWPWPARHSQPRGPDAYQQLE